MFLSKYLHIIYALIVWGFIFIAIKPQRIKALLPVAFLSAILLFAADYFLMSLKLYKFNNPILSIYGIPLFHLIWGAGSGIIVMNYMKRKFIRKVELIILFTVATLVFEHIAELTGATSHLGRFTELHDAFQDLIILISLVWISDGLWGKRIIPKEKSELIIE